MAGKSIPMEDGTTESIMPSIARKSKDAAVSRLRLSSSEADANASEEPAVIKDNTATWDDKLADIPII